MICLYMSISMQSIKKKLHETDRLVSKCSMKNLDEQWSKPTCDIQILCCSWRDPYTGFLKSLYKWVVNFIPYFVPAQLGWNIATHVWWRKLRKNHSFLQMCKTSLTRKTRTEIVDVQLQSVKSGESPARFGAPNHKKQKNSKNWQQTWKQVVIFWHHPKLHAVDILQFFSRQHLSISWIPSEMGVLYTPGNQDRS